MKTILLNLLATAVLVAAPARVGAQTPNPLVVAGADTATLTLEEAIAIALDMSYGALTMELDLKEAEHDVAAARGRFRSRADLTVTAPELEERVQGVSVPGELPRYDSYGSREVSTDLRLSLPLPTDGELSFTSSIFQRDDSVYDPATNAQTKQKMFFNSYELGLSQPLLTPNQLKLGLERAEISHRLAQRAYARGRLDLSYNVTASFYNLVRAQEEVTIARDALRRQQQNYDLAKRKYEAGLIPEVDALQMEVDLAESRNELLTRQADLAMAGDEFRLLVGLPMDLPLRAEAEMAPRFYPVDAELATRFALQHRTELADQQDEIRRAEIIVTEMDARSDLKGELSAFYNLTGVSDPGLTDADVGDLIDSSWDDLRRRPGNRGVRFTLSVPLWDSGVNGNEVAAAEVTVRRRELEQANQRRRVVRQVQAALAALDGATRRLEVLRQSMDIAERSYQISQERFDGGEITSQVLADNRDRLVQARRSYLSAFVNYRLAGADLRRRTLYDFEVGRGLVD